MLYDERITGREEPWGTEKDVWEDVLNKRRKKDRKKQSQGPPRL